MWGACGLVEEVGGSWRPEEGASQPEMEEGVTALLEAEEEMVEMAEVEEEKVGSEVEMVEQTGAEEEEEWTEVEAWSLLEPG